MLWIGRNVYAQRIDSGCKTSPNRLAMPDDDRLRRARDSALGCASVKHDEAGVEKFQWFCLPAEGQQCGTELETATQDLYAGQQYRKDVLRSEGPPAPLLRWHDEPLVWAMRSPGFA